MGGLLSTKRITLYAAVVVVAAIGGLPLCLMIGSSFWVSGDLSLRNYIDVLGNGRTWILFGNSLALAALTTAVAGLVGIPLAILIARTDLPLRNALAVLFSLPILFPPYILAVGWFEVLGREGILARWIPAAAGAGQWLFGLPGAVLVLASAFLPVVLLLTIGYLRSVNPSLEEAARFSAGWASVLGRITIPLISPGIILSLILVFLLTMGEFGAPAFLRVNVFPVASFTQSSAFYNFGGATAGAMPLMAVVLAGLFLMQYTLRDKIYSFRWGGRSSLERISLGSKKPVAFIGALLLAIISVAVPLTGVVWRGSSATALNEAVQRAGGSAMRSLFYAAIAATALSLLGFLVAYLVDRRAIASWWWVDALALFLFTLPGTVLGIGLIELWNRPSTNWIYATPVMLLIALVAQYLALGARIVLAGFSQTSPSLEEAAEISGAGWFTRLFGILMPVLRSPLLISWAVTFLFCLRDVALPLLLAPPGLDTLTARTMTLSANGSPELIAALCVLAILLALLPLGGLGLAWRFWSRPA